MRLLDLKTLPYRDAWAIQEEEHARVVAGEEEVILLVEHPPVITFGRRGETIQNLVATQDQIASRGVEIVESDRGGDVTFHGPGQLVVYPIIRLIDHHLSVGGYMHRLEDAVVATLAEFGIRGHREPAAVGVWVNDRKGVAAKVCALGVRIKGGASLHGLALNVTTDLSYFDLFVPCGLVGRPVTSLAKILGNKLPAMGEVKRHIVAAIERELNRPK